MKFDEIERRNKVLNGFLMALFFCVAIFIIAIGFNIEKPETCKSDVFEGAIYTDGVLLTDFENLDSNNPEKQHARSLTYPKVYSYLLGYNSTRYGTSGLRELYSDWFYDGKRNGNGNDLHLTINHNLQLFCYDELNAFGKNGSIVVIDNDTGAIRALVSTKESGTFNANEVDSLEIIELPDDGFLIGDFQQTYLPGSTFKVLSAIALIENGNDDYEYNDKTGYISYGGGIVHNAGNSIKGELDLKNALKQSANVYFVSALEKEGFYNQLKDVASRFKLGEEIQLDFCTVHSSFDYTPENDFQKALAVFGQGNETSISPIQLSMIFSTIMNEGEIMYKPFVIETNTNRTFFDYIFNTNHTVKPEVQAKNVISKKTAKQIKEALEYTAVEGYSLPGGCIGKTGTAELADGKRQLWLVCSNEKYSICISITSSSGYGSNLVEPMKRILEYIDNNDI